METIGLFLKIIDIQKYVVASFCAAGAIVFNPAAIYDAHHYT